MVVGGWFNIENAFDNDCFDYIVIKLGVLSFLVGMLNYVVVYVAVVAFDYIDCLGVDVIHVYV